MGKGDKELADEVYARDRLRARRYELVPCKRCGGLGLEGFDVACPACEGKGYHWQAPLTK